MNLRFIKKGIVIAAFAGAVLVPSGEAKAADITPILALPKQNKEAQLDQNVLINAAAEISRNAEIEKVSTREATFENTFKIESAEEMKMNALLAGKAFAVIGEDDYLLVSSTADENTEEVSDWVGKLYETSVVKVVKQEEKWIEIESGDVKGFVKAENLLVGKEAIARAKDILSAVYPDVDIYTLDEEKIEACFTVGETREAEEARIAAEEARRKAEEEARKKAEEAKKKAEAEAKRAELLQKGQSVVSYARQFIGNPYVWGGTSLTNGADCSGFVKGVYANFGIYLPRTSYAMRSAGRAVSYSEMLPGDIVCYSGHVGIYAGNGQIVNAIDESHGIGMTSATYAPIITIRRMY